MELKITKLSNRYALAITSKMMMENGWKLGDTLELEIKKKDVEYKKPAKPLSTVITPDKSKVKYRVKYKKILKDIEIVKEATLSIDRDPETPSILLVTRTLDKLANGCKIELISYDKVID